MENFANLVSSVWNQGVFGIDLNNILVAIVILFIFVILRSIFSKIVIGRLKVVVNKSKTKIDDAMLEAFDGPLRFFPVVIGVYISTQYLNLKADGQMDHQSGQVDVVVNFRTPLDISPEGVKFDGQTIGVKDFSGLYQVTQVNSVFSGNEFRQELLGVRRRNQGKPIQVADMLFMAESDYMIFTFSSNFGQAAFYLNSWVHNHRPTYCLICIVRNIFKQGRM